MPITQKKEKKKKKDFMQSSYIVKKDCDLKRFKFICMQIYYFWV